MKKLFPIFFFLFSVGALSAQNINFKDTNGLKTLLCNNTWICYIVNPDSSFSEKVVDSIKFYPDGTWYQCAKSKGIAADAWFLDVPLSGKWVFDSAIRASDQDTIINCIGINMQAKYRDGGIGFYHYTLIDGHGIKGTYRAEIVGKLEGPFIVSGGIREIYWNKRDIWQPKRQPKKPKKHQ